METQDLYDHAKPTKLLCRRCLRPTCFAANTNRYVCPKHGPVVTTEFLASHAYLDKTPLR